MNRLISQQARVVWVVVANLGTLLWAVAEIWAYSESARIVLWSFVLSLVFNLLLIEVARLTHRWMPATRGVLWRVFGEAPPAQLEHSLSPRETVTALVVLCLVLVPISLGLEVGEASSSHRLLLTDLLVSLRLTAVYLLKDLLLGSLSIDFRRPFTKIVGDNMSSLLALAIAIPVAGVLMVISQLAGIGPSPWLLAGGALVVRQLVELRRDLADRSVPGPGRSRNVTTLSAVAWTLAGLSVVALATDVWRHGAARIEVDRALAQSTVDEPSLDELRGMDSFTVWAVHRSIIITEESEPRRRALVLLSHIGTDEAVDVLVWMVEHAVWDSNRSMASRALGQTHNPRAVRPLLELMGRSYGTYLDESARQALVEHGGPSIVPAIAQMLREGRGHTSYMLDVLIDLGGTEPLPEVVRLLNEHPNKKICGASATWLGLSNDPRAEQHLMDAAERSAVQVRAVNAWAGWARHRGCR